jgi:hypothetical protein
VFSFCSRQFVPKACSDTDAIGEYTTIPRTKASGLCVDRSRMIIHYCYNWKAFSKREMTSTRRWQLFLTKWSSRMALCCLLLLFSSLVTKFFYDRKSMTRKLNAKPRPDQKTTAPSVSQSCCCCCCCITSVIAYFYQSCPAIIIIQESGSRLHIGQPRWRIKNKNHLGIGNMYVFLYLLRNTA